MNNWNGIGRITRDPDVRYSQTGNPMAIARYTLAVDRTFKKEGQPDADFISCIAFGKSAEFAEKYFKQGMKIGVTGRIQTGSYTNEEGRKVYTTDIIVEHQDFCEKKAENQSSGTAAPQNDDCGFIDVPDYTQEELPFR